MDVHSFSRVDFSTYFEVKIRVDQSAMKHIPSNTFNLTLSSETEKEKFSRETRFTRNEMQTLSLMEREFLLLLLLLLLYFLLLRSE